MTHDAIEHVGDDYFLVLLRACYARLLAAFRCLVVSQSPEKALTRFMRLMENNISQHKSSFRQHTMTEKAVDQALVPKGTAYENVAKVSVWVVHAFGMH